MDASFFMIWLGLLQLWKFAPAQYTLDSKRPLWILEDQLMKRERERRQEADLMEYMSTTRATAREARTMEPAAITFLVHQSTQQSTTLRPSIKPHIKRGLVLPSRLKLPQRYVQQRSFIYPPWRSRRQFQALPIFDNAPGDNALPAGTSYPFFVYNSTKGEQLVNTMLSTRRYPMQEPVPGQVLYPPSTPMFRPKPVVERFRLPGHTELLNLTLIPFYAHEAITVLPTTSTTTEGYTTKSYEPLKSRSKRKRKMAKLYSAYHSPQEVQWQPVLPASHKLSKASDNHRHYTAESSQTLELEMPFSTKKQVLEEDTDLTASLEREQQQEQPKQSSRSSSMPAFQIFYMDESLERPVTAAETEKSISTTVAPATVSQRQSSRYALKREYYAFPVYTLGKLLNSPALSSSSGTAKSDQALESAEKNSNTWFILNSRYKGPHGRSDAAGKTKYYTSKYIQNAVETGT